MRFRGQNPVYSRVNYDEYSGVSATYSGVTVKTAFLLAIIASNVAVTLPALENTKLVVAKPALVKVMSAPPMSTVLSFFVVPMVELIAVTPANLVVFWNFTVP